MIPIGQLRELQAEFEPIGLDSNSRHKKLEKLRQEFVRRYSPSKIPRLTLDEYVQGKQSKDSFSYWLERKTADLGHIQGAPAIKFGVFYNKKNNKFRFKSKWPSAEDALESVLAEIVRLIGLGRDGDLDEIRSIEISPMVKGKLLYLYHPNRFVNIFSERHVNHFLSVWPVWWRNGCLRPDVGHCWNRARRPKAVLAWSAGEFTTILNCESDN